MNDVRRLADLVAVLELSGGREAQFTGEGLLL
jgi:hypothetical protein